MLRALVLIGSSTALGLSLASLLFGPRCLRSDVQRLELSARVCMLAALLLQAAQLLAHGRLLLGDAAQADWVQAFWASTRTHVGIVLCWQGALLLVAGLLSGLRAAWCQVGVPVALLASLVCAALSGHVAAGGESAAMALVAVLHVVLVGLWFGGLPALWMLWRLRRTGGDGAPPLDMQALHSFSRFALPAMLAIMVSGALLATETVARWSALVATDYGWMLMAKLSWLAATLACAQVLRRSLTKPASAMLTMKPGVHGAWIACEAALACCVIAAAGTLASWVPAAHDSIDWPYSFRFAPQAAWLQRQDLIRWPLAGAAVLVVIGLGVGLAVWRAQRRWALVTAGGAVACGLAIAVPALTVDAYPSTYHASAAPYDSASVANGARLYGSLCAQCHGLRGQGDGPLAAGLSPAPADLTAPHLGLHTHGDMYWWIAQGYAGSAMPAFGAVTTPLERWQIVNYLMALSLGHQARTIRESPLPSAPWLAAINFRYPTAEGGYAQLSELQLNAVVLLVLIEDAAELARLPGLVEQARSLAAAGLKVVVVLGPRLPRPAVVPIDLELVSDTDGEVSAAWSHYRRTLAQPDLRDDRPRPARIEWLIDRYGYVRARWRGDEGAGSPSTDALRAALATLATEPAYPLADVHAH